MPEIRYEAKDTNPKRCQCVMRHSDMKENAIEQCYSPRESNLFCTWCEALHGDYWRKLHPEVTK
jgi:hypothetical protein